MGDTWTISPTREWTALTAGAGNAKAETTNFRTKYKPRRVTCHNAKKSEAQKLSPGTQAKGVGSIAVAMLGNRCIADCWEKALLGYRKSRRKEAGGPQLQGKTESDRSKMKGKENKWINEGQVLCSHVSPTQIILFNYAVKCFSGGQIRQIHKCCHMNPGGAKRHSSTFPTFPDF